MSKLRFAPIIRVSTERQEKMGESLNTQKKIILDCVSRLDGIIPDNCWQYSGQEHATVGMERKKLEQLLEDSGKGLFDAVIVCDASRWSRDNARSKAGLEILRKNGIRFFVGSSEFDLHSPQHKLFLGMSTEMNEFFALEQARKSLINRIARAKRGIPSGGRLPYGRTFDKETGEWIIDKEKQREMQWAAQQYLSGESLGTIAKSLGMNLTNLWKILTKRCGDQWEIYFESEKLNIKEMVAIEIPELLPKKTIDKILERMSMNKTVFHGQLKNSYLLSRMVFCAKCGYAMFGQTNHHARRYYRHARHRAKACDMSIWIPAENLERAVIANLFSMFGDVKSIEQAVERAFPDVTEIRALETQIPNLENKLTKIKTRKSKLIDAITEGVISNDDAKDKMEEFKLSETLLLANIADIRKRIDSLPTKQRIKRDAKSMSERIKKIAIKGKYTGYDQFKRLTFENKLELVQHAFAGKDNEGKRRGVYVQKDSRGNWSFAIKGILISEELLPLNAVWEASIDDSFDPEEDLMPRDFVKKETNSVTKLLLSYKAEGPPVCRSPSGILLPAG